MSATVAQAPLSQPDTTSVNVKTLTDKLSCLSITPQNVEILKTLNSRLFPVPYPEAYYAAAMRPELAEFCKLSMFERASTSVPFAQSQR